MLSSLMIIVRDVITRCVTWLYNIYMALDFNIISYIIACVFFVSVLTFLLGFNFRERSFVKEASSQKNEKDLDNLKW